MTTPPDIAPRKRSSKQEAARARNWALGLCLGAVGQLGYAARSGTGRADDDADLRIALDALQRIQARWWQRRNN